MRQCTRNGTQVIQQHCKFKYKASLKKVSVSTNPTYRILNGQPQTFFTPPQKFFLYTRMCMSDLYRSQYHTRASTRVPNVSVSERMRAMHCPHTRVLPISWNRPDRTGPGTHPKTRTGRTEYFLLRLCSHNFEHNR